MLKQNSYIPKYKNKQKMLNELVYYLHFDKLKSFNKNNNILQLKSY